MSWFIEFPITTISTEWTNSTSTLPKFIFRFSFIFLASLSLSLKLNLTTLVVVRHSHIDQFCTLKSIDIFERILLLLHIWTILIYCLSIPKFPLISNVFYHLRALVTCLFKIHRYQIQIVIIIIAFFRYLVNYVYMVNG